MTDQKITTSQDILDQHYEEVERLHKLIVTIALASDGQDARVIALKELGWSSVSKDTTQTVGGGIIAGLKEAVETDLLYAFADDDLTYTPPTGFKPLCHDSQPDLGPRWSKKS